MKSVEGFFIVFIFAACSHPQQNNVHVGTFHPIVNHKLKEKAVSLQKKLQNAERSLLEDQSALERLRIEVCQAELNVIETQIENLEQKWKNDPQKIAASLRRDLSNLFLEERKTIDRVIQKGPDATRAQLLLNRILQLITQVGDYSE